MFELLHDFIRRPSRSDSSSALPRGMRDTFTLGYNIPQPIIFPDREANRANCALCSLLLQQEQAAQTSSSETTTRSLELAALYPPNELSHAWDPFRKCFLFGEPQPQWYGLVEGEQLVNKLEPVFRRSGSHNKMDGYVVKSPWQVNVATDIGIERG